MGWYLPALERGLSLKTELAALHEVNLAQDFPYALNGLVALAAAARQQRAVDLCDEALDWLRDCVRCSRGWSSDRALAIQTERAAAASFGLCNSRLLLVWRQLRDSLRRLRQASRFQHKLQNAVRTT